jgi:hypothetical protein
VVVVAGPVEYRDRRLGNFDKDPRQVVERFRHHDVGVLAETRNRFASGYICCRVTMSAEWNRVRVWC